MRTLVIILTLVLCGPAIADDVIVCKVTGPDSARLGDMVTLQVENSDGLPKGTESLWVTFKGLKLKGIPVSRTAEDEITFRLLRTETDKEAWTKLANWDRKDRFVVGSLSLAAGNGVPFETEVTDYRIELYTRSSLTLAWIAVGCLAIGLLVLGARSNLVRDLGAEPLDGRKSFSLARCQMGWWFLISVGLVIVFSVSQGTIAPLSETLLILIGIGTGTTAASALVDAGANVSARETQGFFRDILSDSTGVALYRFQNAVWTIILGILFVARAYADTSIPDLDTSHLTLMGISAGGYVFLKVGSSKAPPAAPAGPAPPAGPPAPGDPPAPADPPASAAPAARPAAPDAPPPAS